MRDILENLSGVGFFRSIDFPGPPVGEVVPVEMIAERLKDRKQVPASIIEAILNIDDELKQKKAAAHLLRIVIFAKSISSRGKVLRWFEMGKVVDHITNTKIRVSILMRAAENFNRHKHLVKKSADALAKRLKKKSGAKNVLIEKAELRVEAYEKSVDMHLEEFLQVLDLVYVSLASERK